MLVLQQEQQYVDILHVINVQTRQKAEINIDVKQVEERAHMMLEMIGLIVALVVETVIVIVLQECVKILQQETIHTEYVLVVLVVAVRL